MAVQHYGVEMTIRSVEYNRWWRANTEKGREWTERNRVLSRERRQRLVATVEGRERVREADRRLRATPEGAEAHRQHSREWSKNNPRAKALAARVRYARLKNASVVAISERGAVARWDYFAGRCWMCSRPANCWDHVKPLSKGGLHLLSNLRPACTSCNSRKRDRWPYAVVA